MRYLPAATIAGRDWVSPDVCRRWLPVWFPVISLARLTLMPHLPTEDAGVAVATARPAPHPAHMPTWPAGTGSDCGRPVVLPPHPSARQAKGCRCAFHLAGSMLGHAVTGAVVPPMRE